MKFEPQLQGKRKVNEALKVGEQFEQELRLPVLLFIPIGLLLLSAMDHFTLMFNHAFTERFLARDQTLSFLGGFFFGGLMMVAVFFLWRKRRLGVWLVLVTLGLELAYTYFVYAGGDTATMQMMRTPVMNWMDTGNVTLMGMETGLSSGAAYFLRTIGLGALMVPFIWMTE